MKVDIRAQIAALHASMLDTVEFAKVSGLSYKTARAIRQRLLEFEHDPILVDSFMAAIKVLEHGHYPTAIGSTYGAAFGYCLGLAIRDKYRVMAKRPKPAAITNCYAEDKGQSPPVGAS